MIQGNRPVFEIRALTCGYISPVLEGLSLKVGRGELLGIIGPNGAGKSTLLHVLSGELAPWSGSVSFLGRDIRDWNSREKAGERSVVRQDSRELPAFTVREYVRMGNYPREGFWWAGSPLREEKVHEVLDRTGLAHLATRTLNRLSSGELQRAHIARAIVQSDRVLLLDEPVSHLDMGQSFRVMKLLHDLNGRGATIIAILHDINIAAAWCSRIAGLREGRLVFDGRPEDVVKADILRELFETDCQIITSPVTGKPAVLPPAPSDVTPADGGNR